MAGGWRPGRWSSQILLVMARTAWGQGGGLGHPLPTNLKVKILQPLAAPPPSRARPSPARHSSSLPGVR